MNLELLEQSGIDVADGMRRFMNNEKMFEKYLKKFLDNTQYDQLVAEISKSDIDVNEAFEKAHAMKGVCANLSMTAVLQALDPIVETLRGGSAEGVADRMPALEEQYKKTMAAIESL